MLRVNDEKLINDVANLKNEIANADTEAYDIAKEIAMQRGFGVDFANKLKVLIMENDTAFDVERKKKKLEILMNYIEEECGINE